jgi:hypothetical protein
MLVWKTQVWMVPRTASSISAMSIFGYYIDVSDSDGSDEDYSDETDESTIAVEKLADRWMLISFLRAIACGSSTSTAVAVHSSRYQTFPHVEMSIKGFAH